MRPLLRRALEPFIRPIRGWVQRIARQAVYDSSHHAGDMPVNLEARIELLEQRIDALRVESYMRGHSVNDQSSAS